ncbi:MAG: hypothetical protein J5I53_03945 [Bradyrhizobiaceae bacterium]|nr:hypothetical protein [Bradyrhizobiaceae bacterium]
MQRTLMNVEKTQKTSQYGWFFVFVPSFSIWGKIDRFLGFALDLCIIRPVFRQFLPIPAISPNG